MTPRDKTTPEVAYNVVGDKIGDDREQLLHFPNDEDLAEVSTPLHGNVVLGTVQKFFRWSQLSSIWPVSFGLACCAIEMMSAAGTRYDLDRFGAGAMRGTPRQSDLMIVSGTVTAKMATRLKRLYDQMPEPKWVIAMGNPLGQGFSLSVGIVSARNRALSGAIAGALIGVLVGKSIGRHMDQVDQYCTGQTLEYA